MLLFVQEIFIVGLCFHEPHRIRRSVVDLFDEFRYQQPPPVWINTSGAPARAMPRSKDHDAGCSCAPLIAVLILFIMDAGNYDHWSALLAAGSMLLWLMLSNRFNSTEIPPLHSLIHRLHFRGVVKWPLQTILCTKASLFIRYSNSFCEWLEFASCRAVFTSVTNSLMGLLGVAAAFVGANCG